MSIKKTGTWWSQRSIAKDYYNRNTTIRDSCRLIKQESMMPQDKHTFFPGNEITRNRIDFLPKFLFRADSKSKIIWDFLIVAVAIYLSIIVPFSLSYLWEFSNQSYLVLSSFLLLDILVGFNTSYFVGGEVVYQRQEVAIYYAKTWLFCDVISAFPYELCVKMNNNLEFPEGVDMSANTLRCILLLKLLKLFKVSSVIERISNLTSGSFLYISTQIFSYILVIVIPMHWMICLFNVFYSYYLENDYVYWSSPKIEISDRYLYFLERLMETMTSVGFGDALVNTMEERILMIFSMCITSGFLGFFVGRIKVIVENSSQNTIFFNRIRNNLKSYSEKHQLPKALRTKITSYIRHLNFTYNNNLVKDEDIIKLLSIPLREQIFLCTKGYILVSISFFTPLSRQCIRSFGYEMSLQVFGPFDSIIKQGELTTNLYFINSGSVQIYHDESQTVFIELHKENFFGEIGFLLRTPRTASARSFRFSELYCLSRHDVDKILETMPKDKNKFDITLRNLKTYGIRYINTACYLCMGPGHIARECPDFIWKPNKEERMGLKKNKIVNIEMAPNSDLRKDKVIKMRYGVCNAKGAKSQTNRMFRDNIFLSNKSVEYAKLAMGNERKHGKIFSLINQVNQENSSDESEKEYANFKYCNIKVFRPPEDIREKEPQFYKVKAFSQESKIYLDI